MAAVDPGSVARNGSRGETEHSAMTTNSLAPEGFFRHVVVLMSWTVVAQFVSVTSMLILPRFFLPQQFGVFAVFSGVVVMLGIVAAARYEFAIGLPQDDRDGAALFTLCMLLACATSLVCVLVFAAVPEDNWLFARFPELRPWWYWIALGMACVCWYNAASYLALRAGRFGVVGKSKAVIATATAAGQILAGLSLGSRDGALIVPFLAGQLCGVALIVVALPGGSMWRPGLGPLASVAARYSRFPRFVAAGSLLDGIAVLLPVAVIASVFSPAEAGIYALADRTLKVPVTLVGSSVLQVFYKRVADLRGDSHRTRRLLLQTWRNLALLAILPCAAVAIFGESVFTMIFGETWRASGRVAELLVISVFVFFISYPTSNILVVTERVRSFLVWQVAQVLFVVTALLVALQRPDHRSLEWTVTLLVGAQLCVYVLSMVLQWQAVSVSPARDDEAGILGGADGHR
ncbi:MAG: oligosaccharide flippase family protein [Ramlibacter sp.]|nr:oligosaccharide flippase family protein [Ramlibacter sp.]